MRRGRGLRRGQRLASRTPLARRTRLRARNRKRRKREFDRAYGGKARVVAMRARDCAVRGCMSSWPVVNAHLPSRSGIGRKGDARHVVPLCEHPHHRLLDRVLGGNVEEFDALYGTDLYGLAARLAVEDGVA